MPVRMGGSGRSVLATCALLSYCAVRMYLADGEAAIYGSEVCLP
jgi:hypothetical protein